MDEQQMTEYVERQALMLWGHYGIHLIAARTTIACNLMRGIEPTDDLWERCGKSIEERRLAFGWSPKPAPPEWL